MDRTQRPLVGAWRMACTLGASALGLLLAGCESPAALRPRGFAAARIADIWWFMFWTSLVVFVAVMVFLILALFRRNRPTDLDEGRGLARNVIIWGGGVFTGVVVVVLLVYTVYTLRVLDAPPGPLDTVVEVRSHMFWWDFFYQNEQISVGNEIHIPVGQPVALRLISGDVIHSFWVPELHGKRDLAPGDAADFWFVADAPGEYRGQCAEFCGLQHAKMRFLVVAHEPEDYARWLEQEMRPPPAPTDELRFRGQQIFLGSECVYCHTIRGTNATGTMGPDLTKLARRRELGAGTLPNTTGHLAGWIVNAQLFKPGNEMPPMPISGGDLQAMLAYLNSLH